jgi:Heavy metal binding domain
MTRDEFLSMNRRSAMRLLGTVSVTAAGATFIPELISRLSAQEIVYQCPMDPDVRSNQPGKCPKCGMTLQSGIPEPLEFPMDLEVSPLPIKVGQKQVLTFTIHDPQNDKAVSHFQIVHERLFHMFAVGQDMVFFIHDHPVLGDDGKFRYNIVFPKPGMYRILGDFFPEGATPQLNAKTVLVPGANPMPPAALTKDYNTKTMANMKASITTDPPAPIAGIETRIFLHLDQSEGMELYLGAWAHMLAASDDLVDLIHSHPWQADGGPEMQFRVYFAREHVYRVWFQFQKKSVVNTAYFDIPVTELK